MGHSLDLQVMRPLQHALDDDDNWTGLTSAKARRRRQNRLNQRAHRQRKEQELASKSSIFTEKHGPGTIILKPPVVTSSRPFTFPLSVDYLLTLVQFNVYRALYTNMNILALPVIFSCEEPDIRVTSLPFPNEVPPALMPTRLQSSTLHQPWIDLFPLPAFRDNLIKNWGLYDSCELCDDAIGAMYDDEPSHHTERNGVICWGDPWDVRSWELMEGFVIKWGLLLCNCEELLTATNRWRLSRGEESLSVDLIP